MWSFPNQVPILTKTISDLKTKFVLLTTHKIEHRNLAYLRRHATLALKFVYTGKPLKKSYNLKNCNDPANLYFLSVVFFTKVSSVLKHINLWKS